MKILVSEYNNAVYYMIPDDWKIEEIKIRDGNVFYKGQRQDVEHYEHIDKKPNIYIDALEKFKEWFQDI